MGRRHLQDFRPLRVRDTARLLFENNRIARRPLWYDVTGDIPPSQPFVRPLMQSGSHKSVKGRKPSKMFKPMALEFPEDALRDDFYGDHPWELARPKVILEGSGCDAKRWNWSRIVQPGKKLDGESVVQRQLWLMTNEFKTQSAAYDQARREFYHHRHLEEVGRRIAKEEALATGAYFGKGPLEVGMELEDKAYEQWKEWAAKQTEERKQQTAQMYTGPVEETPDEKELDDFDDTLEEEDQALLPERSA
ncbi:37S ribosomal protein Rsm25 [Lophium mytilinum]|uniref:37S ribosomal protein S25, mitochondrial n=1 Tax=Lophium mytilinum TaxID=390894 RepID=A0A6A6QGE4_9PEZI|nr:37S ribosomal protein Rsm25 [Lophium mytilinum]